MRDWFKVGRNHANSGRSGAGKRRIEEVLMEVQRRAGSRRAMVAVLALVGALAAGMLSLGVAMAAVLPDVAVTDQNYVKANGRPADETIRTCSNNNRQQNEPAAAVDPKNTKIITSGSNDYCTVETTDDTWAGFYRSTDGGRTWTDSLLPGYPGDNSPEGKASPLQQRGIGGAGDPVQEWDNHGRLFYMGNAFNFDKPQNGSVWVATYNQNGSHYVRTRIVGKGTPAINGRFNDKTSIGVDRGVNSPYEGNVYAAWSLFQGIGGNNSIQFVRSTDHGKTFSTPIKISEGVLDNQFADIAVTSDGTIYVTWRQIETNRSKQDDAVVFAKSTDGGRTFTKPRIAVHFESFDAVDSAGDPEAVKEAHEQAFENADGPESELSDESAGDSRDCGSGPFACQSGFVFFRHDSQVRSTADPKRNPNTVYVVFDAVKPNSIEPSDSTYNTAPVSDDGTLNVGQGAVYLTKTTNGGRTWSTPKVISNSAKGHQFFPDINADAGRLFAIWHDSRNDPAYSIQYPPGDNGAVRDAQGFARHTRGLDTYGASSTDGGATWDVFRLSSVTQKPNYEMFGDRRVPFHGDYNYVSSVGAFAFGAWTDNRNVRRGDDPRYAGGESFDVYQCRTKNADGTYSADACPNEGGLDQNIYGTSFSGQ
jgi:hypothetical protein